MGITRRHFLKLSALVGSGLVFSPIDSLAALARQEIPVKEILTWDTFIRAFKGEVARRGDGCILRNIREMSLTPMTSDFADLFQGVIKAGGRTKYFAVKIDTPEIDLTDLVDHMDSVITRAFKRG